MIERYVVVLNLATEALCFSILVISEHFCNLVPTVLRGNLYFDMLFLCIPTRSMGTRKYDMGVDLLGGRPLLMAL